jgi:tRNA threonylcarbamoyl adenosine modification protein YeaZ
MKILAIDTALPAVSVCVLEDGAAAPEAIETVAMERGHAEALLPMIDRVVARIDGSFSALGRVAVTVGPGSFTGLRVGIAAARAISIACSVPTVGVSTLAALAAPLILDEKSEIVAIAIDARHGNVFFAAFEPDGRAYRAPCHVSVREAIRSLGGGPVRLAGSGAPMLAIEAWSMGMAADVAGATTTPDIAFVARLGLLADPETSPARPLYLKPPDAKPQKASQLPLASP